MIKSSTGTSRTAFRPPLLVPGKTPRFGTVDHPLIAKLAKDAAGTFNHCRRVANLMMAAAFVLRIDSLDAWVAGLFHDISKLDDQDLFLEAKDGSRSGRKPITLEQFNRILSHPRRAADKLRCLDFSRIADAVEQHHGTALCRAELVEGSPEPETRNYPGPRPSSKLAALLMIIDQFEAILNAKLSLLKTIGKTDLGTMTNSILEEIWTNMNKEKQLELSGFTYQDLQFIKPVFIVVLNEERLNSLPTAGKALLVW